MPQKSLRQRVKQAKGRGVVATLKDTDLGKRVAGSAHAAKKSRHKAGLLPVKDRKLGLPAAPGEGSAGQRRIPDVRAAYRAENAASGGGRGRSIKPSEPHPRPKAKVKGRKKSPSRMNVKQAGGPKNRSRLHGG
jgi:hypothetical protein